MNSQALLLRIVRRAASLECVDVEDLIDQEFRSRKTGIADLTPSVYEIDDDKPLVERCHSEHATSVLDRPPTGEKVVNSLSLRCYKDMTINHEPGETRFDYTKAQHRSMFFVDEDELREFLRLIWPDKSARMRTTAYEDVIGYARRQLELKDVEWLAFLADPSRKKWKKLMEGASAPPKVAHSESPVQDEAAAAPASPQPYPLPDSSSPTNAES
jgi:hypothetical protein